MDSFLERVFIEGEIVTIERVVDGDTVIVNDQYVRLLGINTPEKGEKYYTEAKEFLESLVLDKEVELRFGKERKDRYNRTLGYLFLGGKNINLEIVEEGYANFYFPSGKDVYYKKFLEGWEGCLIEGGNLCESSSNVCFECIVMKDFDYNREKIVFENVCSFQCDLSGWEIKDEGRKKFIFEDFVLNGKNSVTINVGEGENNLDNLFWDGENYVWTKTGDSLFLRDKEGFLILWETY
tara:strand:- start:618 stop:1328 length:711 start_codon:yes stop_codon:yes gene_type:complete